jgi:hypothetical protein
MPTTVPLITETVVRTLDLDHFEIRWEIESTSEDLSNFQFFVERSEAPEGPFDRVSGALVDTYLFLDQKVPQQSKTRLPYYRVRIERVADTDDGFDGEPAIGIMPGDLRLLEIQRRYNEIFMPRFGGQWCAIFIERTFGQHCDCFDRDMGRSTKSQCGTCFATGWVGGYMNQINAYVQFTPEAKFTQINELGEANPMAGDAWMENTPILKPRDVIVRPGNRRYRVKAIRTTEGRGYISRQVFDLTVIDRVDAEYKIPVTAVVEPDDPFCGFYEQGTPGLHHESPEKPAGSGIL